MNSGILFCHLVPPSQRKLSVDQLINKWRGEFSSIPGLMVFLQNPPPIRIGARFTESQYQLTLQSPNTRELYKYSTILEQKVRRIPDLRGVSSDLEVNNPQVYIDIDRDKAHSLGLTAQTIENALALAYGSEQISTIYTPEDEYWVEMELEPQYQADPRALHLLYVTAADGQLVPLDTVAKVSRTVGALVGQSFGTASFGDDFLRYWPRDLAWQSAAGNKLWRQSDTLPASITYSFSGAAQEFQSSLSNLGLLLAMAILVIYLVLGSSTKASSIH